MSAILKSFQYKILKTIGALTEAAKGAFYLLAFEITLEKLVGSGLVKDSSITSAIAKIFPDIPFLILSPLGQEGVKKDEYTVLFGPLTKKQLIAMVPGEASSIK